MTTGDPQSDALWTELEWREAVESERCGAYWLATPAIILAVWAGIVALVWWLA